MGWHIETAGVIDWAAQYQGPKFHALLCDPPYELGFMGKDWDRSGIAFKAGTWAALAEHLLPGAFGTAFASSRSWHRLAVAIEDAGLRIHPSIFGWCYGSGFPKATRLKGDDRFEGHRYGLQALKPALEPIIVFQKPYDGRPVDSIMATGAGALWIDGGRIAGPAWNRSTLTIDDMRGNNYGRSGGKRLEVGPQESHPQGRWPANFVLSHVDDQPCLRCGGEWAECPDCQGTGIVLGCRRVGTKKVRSNERVRKGIAGRPKFSDGKYHTYDNIVDQTNADPDGTEAVDDWRCVESCPVRRLGAQSGESKSGGYPARRGPHRNCYGEYGRQETHKEKHLCGKGTAARFFFQSDWSHEIAERLALADPVRYVAKASRKERDAGLNTMHDKSTVWGDGLNSAAKIRTEQQTTSGVDRGKCRNPHPTVKPITLTRWLATLLLPPAEYAPRRLLVPFAGTGSEIAGAGLVGWEHILGIEMDADTAVIAEARLRHWLDRPRQLELDNAAFSGRDLPQAAWDLKR